MDYKDETNKRYGRLLVIREDGNFGKEKAWLCLCDCGSEARVRGSTLRNGVTTSCGCYRSEQTSLRSKKELKGQRFGKLVVLEESSVSTKGVSWTVRCDCGQVFVVRGSHLTWSGTKQCITCGREEARLKRETHGESRTKKYRTFLQRLRYQKQKGLDSEWTYEMEQALIELQPVCILCGSTKRMCTDHVYPLSKNYGLKLGNAVRLCNSCNLTKMNKMPEDLPTEWRNKILSAAEEFRVAWESGFMA